MQKTLFDTPLNEPIKQKAQTKDTTRHVTVAEKPKPQTSLQAMFATAKADGQTQNTIAQEGLTQEKGKERDKPFSVSVFSQLLKSCVEDAFESVRIEGEVSMPKLHTSGHLYCTLKDENAALDAVCWRPLAAKIAPLLTHGKKVVCMGKITTYAGRSKYQLVIQKAWPAGEGELYMILAQLKKKLVAEGLFDTQRKKTLPPFPQTVGVITSLKGAVIQDMLHRLSARFPLRVLLCDVSVQGERAAGEIVHAFQLFEKWAQQSPEQKPDLLIVARGGGSLEDLWSFNEESVVRAVAASSFPTISAIGHETDTTLTDFAADLRAPTPTAAAEMATQHKSTIKENIALKSRRMFKTLLDIQKRLGDHASFLQHRLQTQRTFDRPLAQRLDDLYSRLKTPLELCQVQALHLKAQTHTLNKTMSMIFDTHANNLSHLHKRLSMGSYQKTLERGFCLARTKEGTTLTQAVQAKKQPSIDLVFQDGTLGACPAKDHKSP